MNNHKIIIPSISIEETPIDNKTYARKNSTWVETLTKTEIESEIQEAGDTKVDKISGKGLSENDFTNEDKSKVDLIETDGDGNKCLADDGTYSELSSTIDSLTDVEITNLQEGEVLVYNNSVSKWVNMMIDSKTVEEGW